MGEGRAGAGEGGGVREGGREEAPCVFFFKPFTEGIDKDEKSPTEPFLP